MDTSCDECGFVATDYSARDLTTAPTWLTAMADQAMEGVVDPHPRVTDTRDALTRTVAAIGDAGRPEEVHAGIHLVRDLGRRLHATGDGIASRTGTVAHLHVSNGGAPKLPVDVVDVGPRGVLGDRQANRKHHGRPFQALCLWSADVIDALAAEGHPIHPGAAGENVTLAGLDWTQVRPGGRVLIGEVLCEFSAWAEPCRNIDRWFVGRSDRIAHRQHPGWSRIYAWVLEPGTVRPGDTAVTEP